MGRDLRAAAAIVLGRPDIFGFAFTASIAAPCALCILPMLIATHVLGLAVHDAASRESKGRATQGPGAAMLAVLGGPGVASLTAFLAALSSTTTAPFAALAAALAALGLGVVVAPFATVADHLARRERGLSDAIGRALAANALVGARVSLARGLTLGALALVPPWIYAAGDALGSTALRLATLGAIPVFGALAIGLCAVWGEREDELLGQAPPTSVVPSVWAPIAAAAVAVIAAAAVAAVTPSPAFERLVEGPLDDCVPELPPEGPHGLSITSDRRVFDVRTRDGGGAGTVRAGGFLPLLPAHVCRSHGAYVLRFHAVDDLTAEALVDEAGIRLDDGIGTRLRARSVFGPVLLGVAAVALVGFVARGRRRLRYLHTLAAIDRDAGLFVASGRLERGARARIASGIDAPVEGEITFVASDGDLRSRLPLRVTLLGPDGPVPDDATLRLVAKSAAGSMGPRTGTEAWPEGAILIAGSVEPARVALLTGMTRAAAPWVAIATGALALAAIEIVVRL